MKIAGIFSSGHHNRMEIHPTLCGGLTNARKFRMTPKDIKPDGRAAHEFGHLIGVFHNKSMEGDPLMYSNENKSLTNEHVSCIKNDYGLIYPEKDLNYHRNWVQEKLLEKKFIKSAIKLYFEPSKKK